MFFGCSGTTLVSGIQFHSSCSLGTEDSFHLIYNSLSTYHYSDFDIGSTSTINSNLHNLSAWSLGASLNPDSSSAYHTGHSVSSTVANYTRTKMLYNILTIWFHFLFIKDWCNTINLGEHLVWSHRKILVFIELAPIGG